MKAIKCIGIFLVAIMAAALVAAIAWYLQIPVTYAALPLMLIGSAMGVYAVFRMIRVIES